MKVPLFAAGSIVALVFGFSSFMWTIDENSGFSHTLRAGETVVNNANTIDAKTENQERYQTLAEASSVDAVQSLESAIQRMGQRLDALERQSYVLASQLSALGAQAREFREDHDETWDNTSYENADKKVTLDSGDVLAVAEYVQALDYQLESETADPVWSTDAEVRISEALAQPNLYGLDVTDLRCGGSLCRVELVAEGGELNQPIFALISMVPWDGPGFVEQDPNDNGKVILYLGREDRPMPGL